MKLIRSKDVVLDLNRYLLKLSLSNSILVSQEATIRQPYLFFKDRAKFRLNFKLESI